MSYAELFTESGDSGMLVVGTALEANFRQEAEEAGRPDETLVPVESVEKLLDPTALRLAAQGLSFAAHSYRSTDAHPA
jgi:hypothetical protein